MIFITFPRTSESFEEEKYMPIMNPDKMLPSTLKSEALFNDIQVTI